MNNNTQYSSNLTRRLKIMNLRFWGGWFLAIACVCIFLTMGCEKGSLGAKYATVSGRVVNKDNVAMGIPNVTVRLVSKETISGGGDLEQGYNFRSTVTDADGFFLFEKVQPDNVLFEFTASGYKKLIFPSTEDETQEDGSTSESLDIESVTISNGAFVEVGNVLMEKISVSVPEQINIKLEFLDSATGKPVDGNEFFAVSFDGVTYTKRAQAWRESGQDIVGASTIAVTYRDVSEPVIYSPASLTVSGISDQYLTVEAQPVTYNLTFQFLHLPQYLVSSKEYAPILTFLVEDTSTTPPQNISITEVTDFNQLATLKVPAMRNPQQIRIRMHGYEDEVINLTSALPRGEKGAYRVDIDFQKDDQCKGDTPVLLENVESIIGMQDNVITTNVAMNLTGLNVNDRVQVYINAPYEELSWTTSTAGNIGLVPANRTLTARFNKTPSYFDLYYTVVVTPNDGSSSYSISNKDAEPIGYPDFGNGTSITVDCTLTTSSGGESGGGL